MNKLKLVVYLGLKSLFVAGITVCIFVSGFLVFGLLQDFQRGGAIRDLSSGGTATFWFFFFLIGSVTLGVLDTKKIIALERGKKRDSLVLFLIPLNLLLIIGFVAILYFTMLFAGMAHHE
jgi:hypothetical protein